MNKKRNRSVNWDEEEKQLLHFVLKDHVHVIQNKAIDTKTIKLKNKAWEEVYKKFNELNGRHRQLIQLKIQWKTMKINAQKRRTFNNFQREANKPDEGAQPATPSDAAVENLLNTAKLLRENNLNERNEIDKKPMIIIDVDSTCDKYNQENQKLDHNIKINNDGIAQVNAQKYPSLAIPKQKVMANILEDSLVSKKVHDDCVSSMVSHIKMIKEEEHRRQLQMAEEEHSIKIAIQMEKLKSATLEREILELKKAREDKILTELTTKNGGDRLIGFYLNFSQKITLILNLNLKKLKPLLPVVMKVVISSKVDLIDKTFL